MPSGLLKRVPSKSRRTLSQNIRNWSAQYKSDRVQKANQFTYCSYCLKIEDHYSTNDKSQIGLAWKAIVWEESEKLDFYSGNKIKRSKRSLPRDDSNSIIKINGEIITAENSNRGCCVECQTLNDRVQGKTWGLVHPRGVEIKGINQE